MTQSKKNDDYTITLDSGETLDLSNILDTTGDITINLNDTMGATYWAGDSISDITISGINNASNGTFTIASDTINIGDWNLSIDGIYPSEVEKMCKEYPALERVWRNFKSVYDMVKQDYEGKKKAGEIDDDHPF